MRDLPHWLADELWRVELGGDVVEERDMVVAARGRLLERVERWSHELARGFAEACAWRARDHAVRELDGAGHRAEAETLARADGLPQAIDAAGAGCSAAERARDERLHGIVNAAMTTAEHAVVDTATPAYVCWAAFAGYGAAVTAGHCAPGGDGEERELQAAWLAERLELA